MFGVILFICLASTAQSIRYGVFARYGDVPYIALLHWYSPGYEHICGGTILNEKYILTSAYCGTQILEEDEESVSIYVGTLYRSGSGSNPNKIRKLIIHPNYDPAYLINDIALIHVESDIIFGEDVQPIQLASSRVAEGVSCRVSGWGLTEHFLPSYRLKYDNYKVETAYTCGRKNDYFDEERQLCVSSSTKYQEEGAGDTGGPLVCDNRLVGVYSKNPLYSCCGTSSDNVYFTNVTYFADWVQYNMK